MLSQKDVAVKIRKCANDLLSIAEELEKGEVQEAKPITLEEVRKVLAELSRDGFTANVRDLLNKHGASKLSEISPDKYEALLDDARKISNGR